MLIKSKKIKYYHAFISFLEFGCPGKGGQPCTSCQKVHITMANPCSAQNPLDSVRSCALSPEAVLNQGKLSIT
uniref:Uncharacterized protein n=1 Tax=Populus trichocarpa TaxID=3694 RepID=U5FK84_POPTR